MERLDVFIVIIALLPNILWIISLLVMFFSRRKLDRFRKVPTVRITDVRSGLVEVEGVARPIPGKELRTPITGTPCIKYKTEVYTETTVKRGDDWETERSTIWNREEGGRFLLQDGSGSIVVDLGGRSIGMGTIYHEKPKIFQDPPISARAQSFCERYGISTKGPLGILYRNLHFEESAMKEGQHLFVAGEAGYLLQEQSVREYPGISHYSILNNAKLIVTTANEASLVSKARRGFWIGLVLSVIFFAGSIWWMYMFLL